MRPEETNFFNAVLIAGTIFFLVLVTFFATILRYSKKGSLNYLKKVDADFKLVEKEKKRIANDVHDGIGSNLSAVRLLVDELLASGEADDELKSKIAKALRQMSSSVREVSSQMVPYVLEREGLVIALTELINSLFHGSTVKISTEFLLDETLLSGDFGLQVYRIAQELLHNISKHAKANHIYIAIKVRKDVFTLTIRDDGIGFDQSKVKRNSKGIGLVSVSSRIILLEGKIYLTTLPGKGTEYIIELPVRQNMFRRGI